MQSTRTAYGHPEAPSRTARMVEYDLFARVTKKLSLATARQAADFPGLVAALHENQTMWRTLALDVAEPQNGLPRQLRAQLFYLYEFTVAHSRRILAKDASAEVLIDINTAVMRGLRGDGGGA